MWNQGPFFTKIALNSHHQYLIILSVHRASISMIQSAFSPQTEHIIFKLFFLTHAFSCISKSTNISLHNRSSSAKARTCTKHLSCSQFLRFYSLYKFFFLTHMLLLLVFVTSFNLFSLPFSLVSTFSHGLSFLILVPFLTFLLILIFLFHFLFPYLSFTWTSFFLFSTLSAHLSFTCFLSHLFITSPILIPFPRLIVSCPSFMLFQKWTGDKVMRPHSPPIPRFDPLVTGASREQGIVGYAMAEQLWRGQGSAALTTACCRGRGSGAAVARAVAGCAVLPIEHGGGKTGGRDRRERET